MDYWNSPIVTDEKHHKIDIRIKHIDQLFNSLDPSPFLEKDLDDDAFEYLVSSVSEHSHRTHQKIIIHLPKSQHNKISEIEIRRSIHNFFEYKMKLAEKGITRKIREGQFSFIVGITFLVSCILIGEYVSNLGEGTWNYIIVEGLLIGGWVAMWKPISDLLYEWWPIWKDKKMYHKISEMDIEFTYE